MTWKAAARRTFFLALLIYPMPGDPGNYAAAATLGAWVGYWDWYYGRGDV